MVEVYSEREKEGVRGGYADDIDIYNETLRNNFAFLSYVTIK